MGEVATGCTASDIIISTIGRHVGLETDRDIAPIFIARPHSRCRLFQSHG